MQKKVKKSKNSLSISRYLLVAFFIFIFLIMFLRMFDVNLSKKRLEEYKNTPKIASKSAGLKYNVSPTPRQLPNPVPLTGYCLKVPVLMYHHIQPQDNAKQLNQAALSVDSSIFDTQMQYLSQNGYTTLFANELIYALINHQPLPPKSVVITMDDGYEDNYIYALPILKKYNLKANIMLASGLMNNSNMLSWDEVKSLKSSGLVYFTNHTWSHHSVIRGSLEKINMEIDIGQKILQDNTGQIANVFTYPYGEFNKNAQDLLKSKGYIGAFTEIPGQYQCDSFLLTLHRTRIGNSSLPSYGL